MVLIYDVYTGSVVQYYSGTTSQIGWLYTDHPETRGKYREIIIEDDLEVSKKPLNYRVIANSVVPKIQVLLTRKGNELNIELSNTHKTDNLDNIKIPILIGDKRLDLELGSYEIELNAKKSFEVHVDSTNFVYKPLVWEVD